jgi:hypothetical protein
LHKQVENLAFVVDRAPQPELPAPNRHGHLVEMPTRRWPWTSMAKFSGEQRPELQDPSPHRFIGDIQTALREQIFGRCHANITGDAKLRTSDFGLMPR